MEKDRTKEIKKAKKSLDKTKLKKRLKEIEEVKGSSLSEDAKKNIINSSLNDIFNDENKDILVELYKDTLKYKKESNKKINS